MNTLALVYVAFGGAFGACLRYVATDFVARINTTSFPYGTLSVNIVGSLLMGVWLASVAVSPVLSKAKDLHLLLAVGVLGGFTTFSAFSFDLFQLVERGDYMQAAGYAIGSVLISLAALVAGMWLVKMSVA